MAQIGASLGAVMALAPPMYSRPIGPSRRLYANTALVLMTDRDPETLLADLQTLERAFGRRAGGRRWTARVLDCDLVLWSGGAFASPSLTLPHRLFRERDFVLGPAAVIAPDWRDPVTGLTVRQLRQRLTGQRPLPRSARAGRIRIVPPGALSSVGRATDF